MSAFYARKTRRDFLRDSAAVGAAVTFGGSLLTACGTSSQPTSGGKPSRKNTVFVGGYAFSPPTTFNPFSGNPAWPGNNGNGYAHIQETLFAFDLRDGSLQPSLAKALSWPDKSTAVVTLQEKAHFSDGKPVTADDVIYTFGLAKNHPEIPYADFPTYVAGVTKRDDHTVQLTLSQDTFNPYIVRQYLVNTPIVPQHVWAPIEARGGKLTDVVDMNPVGSGPFKVSKADQTQIVLARDDSWWGTSVHGAIVPAYLIHPIFKDNDSVNLALQNGDIDYSQAFAPQIWLMWEQRKLPVKTWYRNAPYHIPGQIPLIWPNIGLKGLDNPKVRLALAYSINYADVADKAMSRYSVPANASLIVPQGAEQQFYDAAHVASGGWKYDPTKATSILENDLGAKKGSDGIYVLPDGTRLGPWKAQAPYGWTDWNTTLQVVADSAKKVGIDITADFPQQTQYLDSFQNGQVDIGMYSAQGVAPSSPWKRFRDSMDNRSVPARGQTAFWNWNRFSNPDVARLLTAATQAASADLPAAYAALDDLFRANLPVIPMEYRPLEFYQVNETHWKGFPDESHSYAPPSQMGQGIRMLSRISPA